MSRLVSEMNEYPAKVAVIFFKAVIERPDVGLIEKTQHPLFELAAAFARNNLDQGNPPVNCSLHNPVKFRLDPIAAVIDVVQV